MASSHWSMYFDRGIRSLARHNPSGAIHFLQMALEKCPASSSRDLYRICLFLGVALKRMGFSQSAIKSWISCQRLNKRGHTRKMLARLTNSYGMERRASAEEDDCQAFSSVQIARYLMSKNKRTFSTLAEKDMITDLIRDSWESLQAAGGLNGKSTCEKMENFRRVMIVFPTSLHTEPSVNGPVIGVNFQTKKKLELEERCPCGSGLPFMLCCGRTPANEELLSGIF
ncbi:MAG TPA: SEC-C metal-binding domain-containing protein [Spirochaetia bacterium]|nr:SEC-C metal-binding domain-containing protein [Spirochaetia bacterium]